MQIDLSVGSVLSIPVSGPIGYAAQVLRRRSGFILVAASEVAGEDGRLGPPRLVALTFETLVKNGQWAIVRRQEPDPTIPIPVYKVPVSSENAIYIQDIDGKLRRRATDDEIQQLSGPVTYSPVAFQKAVDQIANGGPLESRFTPMLPNWEYCQQTLLDAST